MTNKQYKNIIQFTVSAQKDSGEQESISVIKKVMDNCGVAFPAGDRTQVVKTLSSGTYVGWQHCTAEQAQAAANAGIAAVGIGAARSIVVEPEQQDMLAGIVAEDTPYSATVASLSEEETQKMAFFAPATFSMGENGEVMAMATAVTTTYAVQYHLYNEAVDDYRSIKRHNVPLTLATPVKEGYLFRGWALSPDGEVVYQGGANYTANQAVELYAVWMPHVFSFKDGVTIADSDVREKALRSMDQYYLNHPDLQAHIDQGKTGIFAFEGLGEGFGKTSVYHPNGFLNAMMLVTKGFEIQYVTRRASTLPDNRPDANEGSSAATTLKEGVYDYKQGFHNGQYAALRPKYAANESYWPSWYLKSTGEFWCGRSMGINLHATGQKPSTNNPHSKGCQTVYLFDYFDFGKAVGFLKDVDLTAPSASGYSSSLSGIIGPENDKENYVEVKYVLDRSYDEKNTNVIVSGAFYPTEHTHISDCKE